jgi:murein DD-endopeptidase MepM/ murein hydrolase activator NlpD
MRILIGIVLVLVAAIAVTFWVASRVEGPAIRINQPSKVVGADGTLDVTVEAPRGRFKTLEIALEQNGKTTPLFSLPAPGIATMKQETPDRVRITRAIGKRTLPDLQQGTARIVVTASRSAVLGLRTPSTAASRDVQVRLTPPRVSIISTHHYINHGGAEMVVYRVSPPDVESGVRVGNIEFRGFPGTSVGLTDPALRVAFFALLYDQDLNAPIALYARDEAGNQSTGQFDYKIFEKPQKRSRIELNDSFLQRVVPDILEHTPDFKAPTDDPLAGFLKINGDLRRIDAEKTIALDKQSAPQMLWKGPFRPLGNAAVESKFADHRTYIYQGKEVDQQVHLGFDLAVTTNIQVLAGNAGKVLYADYFGIYGNCVILDHGMGVESLYGHLSSIDVKAGQAVEKDQQLGRSGMTGLAAGDHLHFGILVGGYPVNPVEWWDPHWIQDRILRKIQEAGAPAAAPAPTEAAGTKVAAPRAPGKPRATAKRRTAKRKR